MHKKRKLAARFCTVLLSFLCIILSALPALAATPTPPAITDGRAVILYDKTHGKFMAEQNADSRVNTSTSAKIMTGLIACEKLSARLDDAITVTEEMLDSASGYSMKLKAGERITVRDLLYGAICGSYNDAAYVLASVIGGDSNGFVAMMNEYAVTLGAKNTSYTNPLGYPDNTAMVTTAHDTLKIALAASENELYMEICSALKHTVPATNKSEERQFYNRNFLISSASDPKYYNAGCRGMNAGYSGEAGGWSVVTLAQDDGADYICVLLGGTSTEDDSRIYAYETVNKLIKWVSRTYNNYTVFPAGAQLGTTSIGLTSIATPDAPYVIAEDLVVYIPTESGEVTYSIDLQKDLKAPLHAGDEIGRVTVSSSGEVVGTAPLILKEDYEVNAVMLVIDKIGAYTKSRAFIATILCFIILTVAVIAYKRLTRYSSRGRYTRRT